MIARHDALRTVFRNVDGRPVSVVTPRRSTFDSPYMTYSSLDRRHASGSSTRSTNAEALHRSIWNRTSVQSELWFAGT